MMPVISCTLVSEEFSAATTSPVSYGEWLLTKSWALPDFGFCFDIAPGGIRFERAPFKLTSEMVAVMGGSVESQSYHWFEDLCIKAFLASRPYADRLIAMVRPMLDSGLPCFKPETLQHLRERFVLERSDREAADFMRDLIKKSHSSYSTRGYDQFQLMTNGIPY